MMHTRSQTYKVDASRGRAIWERPLPVFPGTPPSKLNEGSPNGYQGNVNGQRASVGRGDEGLSARAACVGVGGAGCLSVDVVVPAIKVALVRCDWADKKRLEWL